MKVIKIKEKKKPKKNYLQFSKSIFLIFKNEKMQTSQRNIGKFSISYEDRFLFSESPIRKRTS